MLLIAEELFRLQALAFASLAATTTRELELQNADQPELPSFNLDDMVLFYHQRQEGAVISSQIPGQVPIM